MNVPSVPNSAPVENHTPTVWLSLGQFVLAIVSITITSIMWAELVPIDVCEEIEYGIQEFFAP